MENLKSYQDDELLKFYPFDFIDDKSENTIQKNFDSQHSGLVLKEDSSDLKYSELLGTGIHRVIHDKTKTIFKTRFTQYIVAYGEMTKFKRNYIFETKYGLLFTPFDNAKAVEAYSKAILDFTSMINKVVKSKYSFDIFDFSKYPVSRLSTIALAHLHSSAQ